MLNYLNRLHGSRTIKTSLDPLAGSIYRAVEYNGSVEIEQLGDRDWWISIAKISAIQFYEDLTELASEGRDSESLRAIAVKNAFSNQ